VTIITALKHGATEIEARAGHSVCMMISEHWYQYLTVRNHYDREIHRAAADGVL